MSNFKKDREELKQNIFVCPNTNETNGNSGNSGIENYHEPGVIMGRPVITDSVNGFDVCMQPIVSQFEERFKYKIDRTMIDMKYTNERIQKLMEKSVKEKKDYVARYIKINGLEPFIDKVYKCVDYIVKRESLRTGEDLPDAVYHIVMEAELYILDIADLYAVVHHVCVMLSNFINEHNGSENYNECEEAIEFINCEHNEILEMVNNEKWEPDQLIKLRQIYDKVSTIYDRMVSSGDKATFLEMIEVKGFPKKIHLLKNELCLSISIYRKVDEIDGIWNEIASKLSERLNYITNGGK